MIKTIGVPDISSGNDFKINMKMYEESAKS